MKRLTLIRHAKSDWTSIAATDFERPLNNRGNKAAPMMGQRMLQRHAVPDVMVSSTARRAVETARLLADMLELPEAAIIFHKEIYEASLTTLIQLIQGLPDHEHIALIGHNPGLSDLGRWLCVEAPEWLPTCAVLDLDLSIERWQEIAPDCAMLLYYDYPKKQA